VEEFSLACVMWISTTYDCFIHWCLQGITDSYGEHTWYQLGGGSNAVKVLVTFRIMRCPETSSLHPLSLPTPMTYMLIGKCMS